MSLNIKMCNFQSDVQITGYSGEVLNRLYGFFRREYPSGILYRRCYFQMFLRNRTPLSLSASLRDCSQQASLRWFKLHRQRWFLSKSSLFPKSSLLDGDFVLLDVERKGAIDFRSLILACRLRMKNELTLMKNQNDFVQTCNAFQSYLKVTTS